MWVLPSSSELPVFLNHKFAKYSTQNNKIKRTCESSANSGETKLFPHQEFVREYLKFDTPYRGLLLYHGLGVGKTCSSIAVAESLKENMKVHVLLPASLRTNYINEIRKCGQAEYVKNKFYWSKSKKKQPEYVSAALREKHGGVWVAKSDRPSNYQLLSEKQIAEIDAQIDNVISNSYQFLHYNGLTTSKLRNLTQDNTINPFDNSVVIVDEVHNMISGAVNGAPIMTTIYKLVLEAKNAKIVLLSGTPIINKPFEIAQTINLVKGFEFAHIYHFKDTSDTLSKIRKEIEKNPFVTWHSVEKEEGRIELSIVFVPEAFEQNMNNRYVARTTKKHPDEATILDTLLTKLKKIDKSVQYKERRQYLTYPNAEDDFDKLFVDHSKGEMKNIDMFTRRAIGAVSVFTNDDPELYPSMTQIQESVAMSDFQFEKYVAARREEHELERRAKKRQSQQQGMFESSPSVYKAYTRAICNFVFPEGIVRPRPSEMDFDDSSSKSTKYLQELDKLIESLKDTEALDKDLEIYSPKFAKILENLDKSPGTALIYSQFRRVEGVGLLTKCLLKHGYKELRIVSTKSGNWKLEYDPDKPCFAKFKTDDSLSLEKRVEFNTILLNIFNNDLDNLPDSIKRSLVNKSNLRGDLLRVMFITQSGAEGISLKNVRQVHVVEPYWNQNREDQVIGRARRMCSHSTLPPQERNFTVYKYLMHLSDSQRKITENEANKNIIFSSDGNLTTDEQISKIAARKYRVISKFLKSLERAAVDCRLHQSHVGCYAFPVDASKTRAYTLEIKKDFTVERRTEIIDGKGIFVVTIKKQPGRRYIYVKETDELFDASIYESTKTLILRGHAHELDDKHYQFKFI
jgi:hypothetical protein